MEEWNSVCEIVEQSKWNSGIVMVEECGATVEQCWWNSVVDQWNSVGGIVEQCWWSSGTV